MKIKDYRLTLVDDDGNEHEIASAPAVEPEASIYAEDGYSQEMKYGVCLRWKGYDDVLDDMIATGDEYDIRAATEAKRWLCVWVPSRKYTEEQIAIIRFHFNRGQGSWFGGLIMNHFGFYPDMSQAGNRDYLAPDAFTPCTTWDYTKVHEYLTLLISNIRNTAARYRQRGTPGAPVPSPGKRD